MLYQEVGYVAVPIERGHVEWGLPILPRCDVHVRTQLEQARYYVGKPMGCCLKDG